ncbi:MAG: sporulation protein YunB [Clostridia bacterium]|nr:sporulation protein YunB [Clostridia bacterium]
MARVHNGKMSLPAKILLVLLTVVIAFTIWFLIVGRRVVKETLSKDARAVVIDVINGSNEVLQRMDIFYDDYFTVSYDDKGEVRAVSANTGLINQMNMIIQTEIQNRLNAIRMLSASLPIGLFTGSTFLSSFGVSIPVRAEIVSNCYTVLKSEFSSVGINNTLHRLQIDCFVEVDMIVPTGTFVEDVSNEILIAETILPGKVPTTYIGENVSTDYLDLLPD